MKPMDKIVHKNVSVNGINMHVAEIGQGPPVLFLHGFPELWYSWRHQMLFLSSKNYRAIAPDLRGYGDSDSPLSPSSYTIFHIVGDLVELLDTLGLDQVYLVAHDWGAIIAWCFCLLRPERIKALVSLSVPFQPRNPSIKPIQQFRQALGDNFYMCRFQEPGEIDDIFSSIGSGQIIRRFLTSRRPNPPMFPKELVDFKAVFEDPIPLPSWLTEEDIDYYAGKFSRTSFTGGLNYYRAIDLDWELTAAWTGVKIRVPAKFIVGDLDMTYNLPGVREYIHGGGFKRDVPSLEEVVVMEGVAHFLNQEKPDEVNSHILDFITKF